MQSCKTCKWLDVPPDELGKVEVKEDCFYSCSFPDPMLPKLPDSITKSYDWRWPVRKARRAHMEGKDGENCPTYASLKITKKG